MHPEARALQEAAVDRGPLLDRQGLDGVAVGHSCGGRDRGGTDGLDQPAQERGGQTLASIPRGDAKTDDIPSRAAVGRRNRKPDDPIAGQRGNGERTAGHRRAR